MIKHLPYFVLALLFSFSSGIKAEIIDSILIVDFYKRYPTTGVAASRDLHGHYSYVKTISHQGSVPSVAKDPATKTMSLVRLHKNNMICIYANPSYTIKKVVFEFLSPKTTFKEKEYILNTGTYDVASRTWTGESDTIEMVNTRATTNTNDKICLKAFYVYLSTKDASPTIPILSSFSELRTITENQQVKLHIRNGKVIHVQDGKAYISDNSGIICIENPDLTWRGNDVLNGVVEGMHRLFHGVPFLRLTDNTQFSRLAVTSSDNDLIPTEISVNQLKDNVYQYVSLSEMTIEQVRVSDFLNLNTPLPYPGALFNVKGYVLPLSETESSEETSYHICPIARNGIEFLFKDKMQNTVSEMTHIRVKLARTLLAGKWNTLCLPFSVSAEQINSIFGKTRIREFERVENDVFLFRECDSIQGGKPYLFNPSKTVSDPCFDEVTLIPEPQGVMSGEYGFVGVFNPYEMQTDGTQLFLSNGNLKKPLASGNKMAGMRAYFVIPPVDAHTKSFSLDNTLTGIKGISRQSQDRNTVYQLDGKRVINPKAGLRKGIYIIDRQKIVIP